MTTRLVAVLLSISLFSTIPHLAAGQTAEVFAVQAPDCTTQNTNCQNFLEHVISHVSGIGYFVRWSQIDITPSDFSSGTYDYSWTPVENFMNAYINPNNNDTNFHWTTGCVNGSACKIMFIVDAETDSPGSGNFVTPAYVFSPTYATFVGSDSPQDVVACGAAPGSSQQNPLPYTGDLGTTGHVVWNHDHCSVVEQNGNNTLSCPANISTSNFTAFPVVYEKPIITAYQAFLTDLSSNFNKNNGHDSNIGKYISYVRAGLSTGGENYPVCEETNGPLPLPDWQASTAVPAGVVITPTKNNAKGYSFVSLNAGTTGASAPAWNQMPGNRNTNDNNVLWEDEGPRTAGTGATAIWPGPNGQFGSHPQPGDFQDNGYLSHWTNGIGGQGYVSQMTQFLGSLSSTFNWDFATNFGSVRDITYADADAVLASTWGDSNVGFGMQSLSVEDPVTCAPNAQNNCTGPFPTSREDWIANFTNYPNVGVHHLQTNVPGTVYFAAGYPISQIDGNAATGGGTITCSTSVDCSWFGGDNTMWVYYTGPGGVASIFDGPWVTTCNPPNGKSPICPTNDLTFADTTVTGGVSGGTVWSANYWPNTLKFSVTHGATRLEVFECDLDYAFGTITTTHSSDGGSAGCAKWGLAGPGANYQNALSSVQ